MKSGWRFLFIDVDMGVDIAVGDGQCLGNPLSFGETTGGYYFASLPEGLPGRVVSITDQYVGVLVYQDGAAPYIE